MITLNIELAILSLTPAHLRVEPIRSGNADAGNGAKWRAVIANDATGGTLAVGGESLIGIGMTAEDAVSALDVVCYAERYNFPAKGN
jgi:hypothetical protein